VSGNYTGHVGDGPIQVIVDDQMMGDEATLRFLFFGLGQPSGDLGGRVTPTLETHLLMGARGWNDENHDRTRDTLEHLLSALHLDDQDDVTARPSGGDRRAVQVVQVLGPLEKDAVGDAPLERRPIDEVVGVVGLAGTLCSRRPRTAQPQAGVGRQQTTDDGVLTDTARTGDDEDAARARSGPSLLAQDREGIFSNSAWR